MSLNRTMLSTFSRSARIAITRSTLCPATTRFVLPSISVASSRRQKSTMAAVASSLVQPASSRPSVPANAPVQRLVHSRNIADDARIGKIYSFGDIKAVAGKDPKVVIVDSREPHELVELGRIPGAINIPIDSAPDSYAISGEDFEGRFGYSRPPKDAHLVTYCRSGVRCHTAAELAKQAGFTNVNEYPGSFNDWSSSGGEIERK